MTAYGNLVCQLDELSHSPPNISSAPNTQYATYHAQLCTSVKEVWYRVLQILRSTKGATSTVKMWLELGQRCGLDEQTERAVWQRDAESGRLRNCDWRECRCYIMMPSEKPKACAGCKRVYYCDAVCQKKCVDSCLVVAFVFRTHEGQGLEGGWTQGQVQSHQKPASCSLDAKLYLKCCLYYDWETLGRQTQSYVARCRLLQRLHQSKLFSHKHAIKVGSRRSDRTFKSGRRRNSRVKDNSTLN
jgi:hypothetical protein